MKSTYFGLVFGTSKNEETTLISDSLKMLSFEEIGKYHRFFLNWRHALFGGYILIVGFLLSKIIELKFADAWVLIPIISGLLIGVFFILFDVRIWEIYDELIRIGNSIEGEFTGNYHALIKPPKKVTHTQAIFWFYLISTIGFFILLILFIFVRNCSNICF